MYVRGRYANLLVFRYDCNVSNVVNDITVVVVYTETLREINNEFPCWWGGESIWYDIE